jgi:hypothetical protein
MLQLLSPFFARKEHLKKFVSWLFDECSSPILDHTKRQNDVYVYFNDPQYNEKKLYWEKHNNGYDFVVLFENSPYGEIDT